MMKPARQSFWFKVTCDGRYFYVEALDRESLSLAYAQMRRNYPAHDVFAVPASEALEWVKARS